MRHDLHRDIGISTVKEGIKRMACELEVSLHFHTNAKALRIIEHYVQFGQLKRKKNEERIFNC